MLGVLGVVGSIVSDVPVKLYGDLFAWCDLFLTKDVPIQWERHSRKDREHAETVRQ